MVENVKLRQERSALAARMKALGDKELREGKLSDAEKSEYGRLDKEQRDLGARIERIEGSAQLYTEMRATGAPPRGGISDGEEDQAVAEYRRAFGRFLRRGPSDDVRSILRPAEHRDMGSGGLVHRTVSSL
jgi:HK97 family phage major capsid protein